MYLYLCQINLFWGQGLVQPSINSCTLSVWSGPAWPKPISASKKAYLQLPHLLFEYCTSFQDRLIHRAKLNFTRASILGLFSLNHTGVYSSSGTENIYVIWIFVCHLYIDMQIVPHFSSCEVLQISCWFCINLQVFAFMFMKKGNR